MSAHDPSWDSTTPASSTGACAPDAAKRAGANGSAETRADQAFSVALWLLGERFGSSASAPRTPFAPADGILRSSRTCERFDAALGMCFDDAGGAPVSLTACFEPGDPAASRTRPANHEWSAYVRTPLDGYFAKVCRMLGPDQETRLVEELGGAIPENAGFAGASGFAFHGIKSSELEKNPGASMKMQQKCLLNGIGPHGELILRFRRIGDMAFRKGSDYHRHWCFKVGGKGYQRLAGEKWLYESRMSDSYFDVDVDRSHKGAEGQLVKRAAPERVADYLVCAPYVAASELVRGDAADGGAAAGTGSGRAAGAGAGGGAAAAIAAAGSAARPSAGAAAAGAPDAAARTLVEMFLLARVDGIHAAFSESERAALRALPWPDDPYDAAAAVCAALMRYTWSDGALSDAVRSVFLSDLRAEEQYLQHLRDWAMDITERDGASVRTDRLEDVYVTPPFTGANPIAWLADEHAGGTLLLQAGSGMGKSTLLRALAAACASARLSQLARLGGADAAEDPALRFAQALVGSAIKSQPDQRAVEGALGSRIPIVLSQTRRQELYLRLVGGDGMPPASFEEFAFEALPPLMQETLRCAAAPAAAQNGRQRDPQNAENPLAALVRKQGAALMVDSIDEIPRKYRAVYLRRLKEFAAEFGVARLMVASRPLPPDDAAALDGLLGAHAARAELAPFDQDRQRDLFRRISSRAARARDAGAGDADASFDRIRATAGFSEVMGNPFMLDAIARELSSRLPSQRRSASWLFARINDKFRKRALLEPHDRVALEHLAFDLTVGKPSLPSMEFIELFRRYRNDEASHQSGGAIALEFDEDEVADLIMSRLGIIDIRDGEVGFPYTAMKGYWAALWVSRCVERAQSEPKSALDIEGVDEATQAQLFERGAETGRRLAAKLLASCAAHAEGAVPDAGAGAGSDAGSGAGAGASGIREPGEGAANETASAESAPGEDAALLALMFTLDHAGSGAHVDYPAFDALAEKVYHDLLGACLFGSDGAAKAAERALRQAAAFAFGDALPGYERATAPYLRRLTAFSCGCSPESGARSRAFPHNQSPGSGGSVVK